jgi:hypothetical protein
VRAFDSANQGNRPLVNQGLQIHVVDSRQRKIEEVAGERRYRDKIAVEEDCVEDCCTKGSAEGSESLNGAIRLLHASDDVAGKSGIRGTHTFYDISHTGWVSKDLEDVLWRSSLFHAGI